MFGPVTVSREGRAALDAMGVDLEGALDQREPLYNIAPTQKAPILAWIDDAGSIEATRWGLVPSWAKDERIGSRLINARAETVAEKPSFRTAFKKRRCLVPASGYFEWTGEPGRKQPYFIHDIAGELLMFAGVWASWKPADGATWLRTFAIITGDPGKVSRDMHDRQPVILPPACWKAWLADEPDVAADLLRDAPDAALTYYPVTRAVGSPKNQGPEMVQPISI